MTAASLMAARLADPRTERVVEHDGDRLMATLGFDVVRFSQARATRQTPGIPDRKYYHRVKRLAVYWEAKRVGGKQSAAQRDFQAMVEAVGETYICGTDLALQEWCRERGLIL